jgi:delta8-fatty-acid desaturase
MNHTDEPPRSGHEPPVAVSHIQSPTSHNTDTPTSDPDIEHLPFFAISPAFFSSLWSSYYRKPFPFDAAARVFVALQHRLFYVVMSLARFNLYRLSYEFLIKKTISPRKGKHATWTHWYEVAGILVFWTWYAAVLRGTGSWPRALAYLLVSNVVPSPLHVQVRVLPHTLTPR